MCSTTAQEEAFPMTTRAFTGPLSRDSATDCGERKTEQETDGGSRGFSAPSSLVKATREETRTSKSN